MVIPTLRVGEKKSYDEAVSNFLDKSIRMIRVNMTRYSLERYCEDIRYIRERSDNALEIMADIPLPGNKYRIDTAQLTSLYELTIPARGELSDIFYLYSMGVEDVVASAGISMQKSLFDRFCDLAGNFMSRTSGETAVQVGGQAGKQTGMQAGETAACR